MDSSKRRSLLEFWHIGLGPNVTYGALVASRRTAGRAELLADSGRQSLIVRYGYPPMLGVETSESQAGEGSISETDFRPCSNHSGIFVSRPIHPRE